MNDATICFSFTFPNEGYGVFIIPTSLLSLLIRTPHLFLKRILLGHLNKNFCNYLLEKILKVYPYLVATRVEYFIFLGDNVRPTDQPTDD